VPVHGYARLRTGPRLRRRVPVHGYAESRPDQAGFLLLRNVIDRQRREGASGACPRLLRFPPSRPSLIGSTSTLMPGSTSCAAPALSSAAPSAAPPRAPAKPSDVARDGSSMSRAGSTENPNPPRSRPTPAPCRPPDSGRPAAGDALVESVILLPERPGIDPSTQKAGPIGPAFCFCGT